MAKSIMDKGMRPLRLTKAVQNVDPIPELKIAGKLNKGANSYLKLKQPTGAVFKQRKGGPFQ